MKNLYLLYFIFIHALISGSLCAQTPDSLAIYGRVISSASGQPMSGVTIRTDLSGKAVQSVSDGSFRLYTSARASKLLITFIGYSRQEINLPGATFPLLIRLVRDTALLQEVHVSTGYQNLPRERVTGSFETLNNELINRSVGTDIISRLEGVTSSLLFDKRTAGDSKLQIRGISTLFASAEPLIILDNFPYSGDVNNINPNDVESVTVLKDAAAASIWGARAGNGVIVITTKKAKFNQPFRLSLNGNVTAAAKPDLFAIREISSSDYIDVQQFLFSKGYYNSDINNRSTFPPLTPAVDILLGQRNGLLSQQETDDMLNQFRSYDVRNDFEKYIYRQSLNQQYALNLSKGTENMKFLFSAGYDRNLTELKGNGYDRVSLRADNTFNPLKRLELQFNVAYTASKTSNNNPGAYGSSNYNIRNRKLYPYARLADEQGNPLALEKYLRSSYADTVGSGQLLDWTFRPLQELASADNTVSSSDLRMNLGASWKFSPAFNASVKYQLARYTANSRNYQSTDSYYTRDLINRYTQRSAGGLVYPLPMGGILDETGTELMDHSLRTQLNFDRVWDGVHNLTAIAGAELRQSRTNGAGSRLYGYNEDLISYTPVDYVGLYPSFNNIYGTARIEDHTSMSSLLNRFVSVYTNVAYQYKSRYSLSMSARKDASNIFGVETNKRGVPLWSAGAAYLVSNEPFYSSSLIPYLNARLTYGYSGNLPSDQSAYTIITYQPASYNVLNVPYAYISNPPNPTLRWEKVGMLNAGIDFGFKGDRIRGSLEYYEKNVRDMIGNNNLDPTTGIYTILNNSAHMRGKGWDITLNTVNVNAQLNWKSSLLFSYVRNKLVRYLVEPATRASSYVGLGTIILPIEGQSPYMLVGYQWAGLDAGTGDPQGYLDGQISKDYLAMFNAPLSEAVFVGPPLPPYFGSFRNTLSYGGLSLSFNISYKLGYYFRKSSLSYYSLFVQGQGHSDYARRWQMPGDEQLTDVPSMIYPVNRNRDNFYSASVVNIEKGDHIRLEDIQLSYDVNNKIIRHLGMNQLQFYGYARNLNVLLWKANRAGIDPNFINGLKSPLSISFGLRAGF